MTDADRIAAERVDSRANRRGDVHGDLLAGPELARGFGLDRARLVLAAGSRAEGLADAASDVDFLAIFARADDLPTAVEHPGTIAMPTALGPNWIGRLRGHEVNVEAVAVDTLERLAEALIPPIGPARAPILQPLEVRLLDRIRTGTSIEVGGVLADPDYLAGLRARLRLDRLPAVVFVMNYRGAQSYLGLAEARLDDPIGFHVAIDAVAEGLALSALCLSGTVLYGMKKVGPALRAAERDLLDPPVRASDVLELMTGSEQAVQVASAAAALERVERAVRARAALGDEEQAEVLRAIEGST
jgi:hypothetical protein